MCIVCDIWGSDPRTASMVSGSGHVGRVDPPLNESNGSNTTTIGASGSSSIDGLLHGSRWSVTALSFAFPTLASQYGSYNISNIDETLSFSAATAAARTSVREALRMVEGFTGLSFSETTNAAGAHIRVAESSLLPAAGGPANAAAYAYFPTGGLKGGDVWLGPATQYDNPSVGSSGWRSIWHELGHALGLKHAHQTGGVSNVAVPANRNGHEFSVMTYISYIGGPSGYPNEASGHPQTFMMDDIRALQQLYGADYTSVAARIGNTIYRFSQTTGQMTVSETAGGQTTVTPELAPLTNRIFRTLWDGGGIDTYDLSSYTTNLRIDLNPGAWSTFSAVQLANLGNNNFARGNLANALLYNNDTRSLIENAIGGSGNDTISGNQAANDLKGGGGNDSLSGDTGADTLTGGAGADTLSGGEGDDWLYFDGQDASILGGNGFDIAVRDDGLSAHGFAMAANGIEDLRWNLSGDSYIATRNITTGDIRVVTNDGGAVNSDWSSFTTDYTSAWVAKVQQGAYDTGGLWSINYDFASNQIFTSYTTVYKAGSILWYQSGTYDNATTWSINWDTENAGNWTQYTTQYDAQSRATSQAGTYDNGTRWTINWDAANAGNWREYTTIYNAAGAAVSQTGIYDNGQTWTLFF